MSGISDERLLRLRDAAEEARRLHYAPYSRVTGMSDDVGVLVLAAAELVSCENGAISTVAGGANIEIANFTLTKHAEEVAILSAFARDREPPGAGRLSALYVAGEHPCGGCRQFAAEFATDDAVWVIEAIGQAGLRSETRLAGLPRDGLVVESFKALLPLPFSLADS
jgi:cytidine deaminase